MDEEPNYWDWLPGLGDFVFNMGIFLFFIMCIAVMIGLVIFFIAVGIEASQDFLKAQRKKKEVSS